MSAAFTPGPWTADAMGNVWATGDTKICDMAEQPRQYADYRKKSPEEHNANRHLIAAAPELLEALKSCLTKGNRWHVCDPVVIQARAAIAKAEGESK